MRFTHFAPNIKISVCPKHQLCRCPTDHTKRVVLIRSIRRRPYRMKPTAVGFISLTTVNIEMLSQLLSRLEGNPLVTGRPLQWCHNERYGVSNHRRPHCLLNCSDTDQRKHQSSASLAFMLRRIHRWPVNSPHKRPVTQKMFPFDTSSWVDSPHNMPVKRSFDVLFCC